MSLHNVRRYLLNDARSTIACCYIIVDGVGGGIIIGICLYLLCEMEEIEILEDVI